MSRPGRLVAVAVTVYGTSGLLACAWIAWRRGAEGLLDALTGFAWPRGLAAGVGVGLMVVGASRLVALAWGGARRAEEALAHVIGPLTTGQCVALALLSGIGEELVFRGVLQPAVGLVAASLVFGLVHVPPVRELALWPVFAAIIGLALGLLARETGGLAAPIAAHVTINALNLRHVVPRPSRAPRPPPEDVADDAPSRVDRDASGGPES